GYAAQRIALTEQQRTEHQQRIESYQAQLAGDGEVDRKRLQRKLSVEQLQLAAVEQTGSWMRAAQPYLQRYTPQSPYPTLLFLMGFLLVGTVVKLLALAANLLLVQVVTERTAVAVRALFYRRALHLDLEE